MEEDQGMETDKILVNCLYDVIQIRGHLGYCTDTHRGDTCSNYASDMTCEKFLAVLVFFSFVFFYSELQDKIGIQISQCSMASAHTFKKSRKDRTCEIKLQTGRNHHVN